MKEAKFTKASIHDVFKVTVRLNQLDLPNNLPKGTEVLADIEGVTAVFKVNRTGQTLATDSFPTKLVHPRVGSPCIYSVSNIYVVE